MVLLRREGALDEVPERPAPVGNAPADVAIVRLIGRLFPAFRLEPQSALAAIVVVLEMHQNLVPLRRAKRASCTKGDTIRRKGFRSPCYAPPRFKARRAVHVRRDGGRGNYPWGAKMTKNWQLRQTRGSDPHTGRVRPISTGV